MSAIEIDIAEAIKDELNGEAFSQRFEAERNYADASKLLTDMDTLHVDVVPWRAESTLADRGELEYTVETDVVIRKRFGVTEQSPSTGEIPVATIDELMGLRQEISEFFTPSAVTGQTGRELTAVPNASWQETKVMASYVRPHLKQNRQFTGWIRLTYQVSRAAGS